MESAILDSVAKAKTPNTKGQELQKKFTYETTTDIILKAIETL